MTTGYLNKFCGWLKRPKIHPEITVIRGASSEMNPPILRSTQRNIASDATMREDSARCSPKRSPSVVIQHLPKLDREDDIRTAAEVVIEDPCISIYNRVKEPGAYLQYQKSLVLTNNAS